MDLKPSLSCISELRNVVVRKEKELAHAVPRHHLHGTRRAPLSLCRPATVPEVGQDTLNHIHAGKKPPPDLVLRSTKLLAVVEVIRCSFVDVRCPY
jgi:hypothetical protein